MTFSNPNFSMVAHSNGHQIFHYVTDDTLADMTGANYFDDAVTDCALRFGDVIIASVDSDGTPALAMLGVTDVTDGAVTVAKLYGTVAPQAAIASVTDSSGGSANDTLEAVGNTSTGDESAAINNNFADLGAKVNAMLVALRAAGVIATS